MSVGAFVSWRRQSVPNRANSCRTVQTAAKTLRKSCCNARVSADTPSVPTVVAAHLPVFEARDLTKVYRMGEVEVHALRGVDLDLYESEFVVILGPSGSGKSTLLNILGGLDVPTSGTVRYRDHDLTAADERGADAVPPRACRLRVPVLQPHPQPDRARERRAGDRHRHAADAGRRGAGAGRPGRTHRPLSRRSCPAASSSASPSRAPIAKRPDVLLCDEPTGALDISTGILVLEAIERINRELGTTTAVITHNAAIAAMADRVISLADGRIVSERRNATKAAPRELRW